MARGKKKDENGNTKSLATQQSVNQVVKSICDIMRRSNCAGAMQYVPELTWILFLRILDDHQARECEEMEALGLEFSPALAAPFRWHDWAAPLIEARGQVGSWLNWRGVKSALGSCGGNVCR